MGMRELLASLAGARSKRMAGGADLTIRPAIVQEEMSVPEGPVEKGGLTIVEALGNRAVRT